MNLGKFTLGSAVAVCFLTITAGCTLGAGSAPDLDRSDNFTQAAQTLDAQLTLAADGAFPTVTPLSSQVGTEIPVITPTQAGDGGPVVTVEPGSTCDLGAFVEDVTIPDGTTFEPGETFVKTWRIRNNGSCTWTAEYDVVFDSGDAMGGPASFPVTPGSVLPGAEVDISINLTAPDEPGSYRGDWKLRNPAGQIFGLGSQGTASFWVVIDVGGTPDAGFTFSNIHACGGEPAAVFRLENVGDTQCDRRIRHFLTVSGGIHENQSLSDNPFDLRPGSLFAVLNA
ncbi:MAG TPA: NBR1-Ig-like domain-containing protein [Anaerolineales bacterium]|nr:NBR1-Ig-like domain-containing protein [Anaerolineales bacterium]